MAAAVHLVARRPPPRPADERGMRRCSELSINTQRLTAGYRPRAAGLSSLSQLYKVILICLPAFFPLGSPPAFLWNLGVLSVLLHSCECEAFEQYSDHLVAVLSQVCEGKTWFSAGP